MNSCQLMGHLTRDIELRYAQSGAAVGTTAIGVNRKWTDASTGEKKEEVSFVDLTFFGKQAETAAEYLKKGSPVAIQGRLKQDKWQDKATGENRSKLHVIVEQMHFLPKQGGDAEQPAPAPAPRRPEPKVDAATVKAVAAGFKADDDVPF